MTPAQASPAFLDDGLSDLHRRDLLTRIDAYYDTAPRATARVEEHGSLVLFVAERGWPFYARPGLTRSTEPTVDEIREVLARQSELKVPPAVEWVQDTAPSLAASARAAGMTVQECPLLALGSLVEPRPADGRVRLMGAEDDGLAKVRAAIGVGFDTPGTAVADAARGIPPHRHHVHGGDRLIRDGSEQPRGCGRWRCHQSRLMAALACIGSRRPRQSQLIPRRRATSAPPISATTTGSPTTIS